MISAPSSAGNRLVLDAAAIFAALLRGYQRRHPLLLGLGSAPLKGKNSRHHLHVESLSRKGKYKVTKPAFFFRTKDEGGTLPQSLKLELSAPDIGVHEKRADDVVQRAVTAREKVLREQAYAEGKTFLGAAKVKEQKIYNSPSGSVPHRGLSPQVAARDKWRRIEVLARNADFVKEHAECRKEFIAGKRDVVFPFGTYRLVKQFGACCAEA